MFEVSKLSDNYKCENFVFENAADSTFLPKTDLAYIIDLWIKISSFIQIYDNSYQVIKNQDDSFHSMNARS